MRVLREEARVKPTISVLRAFSLAWEPGRGGSLEESPSPAGGKRSGAIHSIKICGNFALKLIGSVKFHKADPPFDAEHFSRLHPGAAWNRLISRLVIQVRFSPAGSIRPYIKIGQGRSSEKGGTSTLYILIWETPKRLSAGARDCG